ncbi:MAG: AbrB/MazE/SpoVT family DNA-binding domain-containing protein [Chloroflexi bacterium]|nr:AbrB/MazE/SpoVT family DNA-binding domain-containing protein [Chloroflexota bacterium]
MADVRMVRQLRNGQITIPKRFREALGLRDDDLLSISLEDDRLALAPVRVSEKRPGSAWMRDLYDLYAPVRESLKGESDREINKAIGAAVRGARSRRR